MTDSTKHLNQVELSRRLGVACRTLERWRWQGVGPNITSRLQTRFRKLPGERDALHQTSGFWSCRWILAHAVTLPHRRNCGTA